MNRENPFSALRAVLRRRFGAPLQQLARAVAGRRRPSPRPLDEQGLPSAPGVAALDAGPEAIIVAAPTAAPVVDAPVVDDPASPATEVREPEAAPAPPPVATPEPDVTASQSDEISGDCRTPPMPPSPPLEKGETEPPNAVGIEATSVAAPPAASASPDEVAAEAVDAATPAACPAPLADPGLDALRQRLATLQARVLDLETRKAEIEQLLEEFAYRQYLALGELLGEQLRLQHEILRRRAERSQSADDAAAAAAAAAEYEDFRRAGESPAAPGVELAEADREELKTLYRAAAMRCHPDRVAEADKARAHEFFLRTQAAYRRGDLDALRTISRQLATDAALSPADDAATPRVRLQATYDGLSDKGVAILFAIQALQAQENYRLARDRDRWEAHFAELRERLDEQCKALRRQVARS